MRDLLKSNSILLKIQYHIFTATIKKATTADKHARQDKSAELRYELVRKKATSERHTRPLPVENNTPNGTGCLRTSQIPLATFTRRPYNPAECFRRGAVRNPAKTWRPTRNPWPAIKARDPNMARSTPDRTAVRYLHDGRQYPRMKQGGGLVVASV